MLEKLYNEKRNGSRVSCKFSTKLIRPNISGKVFKTPRDMYLEIAKGSKYIVCLDLKNGSEKSHIETSEYLDLLVDGKYSTDFSTDELVKIIDQLLYLTIGNNTETALFFADILTVMKEEIKKGE